MGFCNHLIAFILGYILDLCFGDPKGIIHPVQIIGAFISFLDKRLYSPKKERALWTGLLLVVTVIIITVAVTGGILFLGYKIHPYLGIAIEAALTWSVLATKSLKTESMKVYERLSANDLKGARTAVSMIVGRDTNVLDAVGVTKAAVETVAENTSDGVVAPMIYTAIGGPVLGYFYKSINTMDSMIGYKNERYLYFGRVAARLDDVVNYIPARIAAMVMIVSAFLLPGFSGGDALRIYRRDGNKSSSPNAAKCESVCAGALGVELLGDAVYFGKIVKKATIGDAKRPVEPKDIVRTNRLMYVTSFLCMVILAGVIGLVGISRL